MQGKDNAGIRNIGKLDLDKVGMDIAERTYPGIFNQRINLSGI